jgi:hypothetical protein
MPRPAEPQLKSTKKLYRRDAEKRREAKIWMAKYERRMKRRLS